MDERDVAALYIAEMQALLPVAQRHIDTLSSDTLNLSASDEQKNIALREMGRLATAMFDLSSGFHAEDCASLMRLLAQTFTEQRLVVPLPPALLALTADLITYVQRRINTMGMHSRVLAPDEAERQTTQRLSALLEETRANLGSQYAEPQALAPRTVNTIDNTLEDDLEATVKRDAIPRGMQAEPFTPYTFAVVSESEAPPTQSDGGSNGDEWWNGQVDTIETAKLLQLAEDEQQSLDEGESVAYTQEELALLKSFEETELQAPTHTTLDEATTPTPSTTSTAAEAADDQRTGGKDGPSEEELDYIPPEMKRLFVIETTEDLQDLRRSLLKFEHHTDDVAVLRAMGRIAHKIRGTAATLEFKVFAALMLTLEDVIQALNTRRVPSGPASASALVRCVALIQAALDAAAVEAPEDARLAEQAREIYHELLADAFDPDGLQRHGAASEPSSTSPAEVAPGAHRGDIGLRPLRGADAESLLRVDVRRLDELMSHMSALSVNRAALIQTRDEVLRLQDDMDHSLDRLAELSMQITDLQPLVQQTPQQGNGQHEEPQLPTSAPFGIRLFGRSARGERHGDGGSARTATDAKQRWDELELDRYTELDQALRMLTEVVADMTTTSKTLRATLSRLSQVGESQAMLTTQVQRDVMQVRLVPLGDLVPRLRLEVRRLADETGKQVEFIVRGEMIEIDRNISEALAEPLIQLVRNAVLHGVESPDERIEHGKHPTAQITMQAHIVGSDVIIEIADDGQGVNPHLLITSAVVAHVLDSDAARSLSEAEALDLMFAPGVTRFARAQMLGGRGLGLDEVQTAIQQLKGSIHARSEPGMGSVFRIQAPISLSIVRALHVRVGEESYAVPFSSVIGTLRPGASMTITKATDAEDEGRSRGEPSHVSRRMRIPRGSISSAGEPMAPIPRGDEEVPVFALAELLGFEYEPHDHSTGLIVDLGRLRAVLLVDDVRNDEEVVVQTLPRHLRRRAVRGATVTPDGQVLLLLDLHDLVSSALDGKRSLPAAHPRPAPQRSRALASRVLVVDDSISIRRALESTLTRAGFEVQLARDGLEAVEQMLVSPPRVMVLDIEMPRLDGFELLSIMRDSPQFDGVRVVMLTSRAAEKHREHALRLGAAAYLIKPCPQETLIGTIRDLLREPTAIAPGMQDALRETT